MALVELFACSLRAGRKMRKMDSAAACNSGAMVGDAIKICAGTIAPLGRYKAEDTGANIGKCGLRSIVRTDLSCSRGLY